MTFLNLGQPIRVKPEIVEAEQVDGRVSYTGVYGQVEKIDGEGWSYIRFRNGVGEWFKDSELLQEGAEDAQTE